MRGNGLRAGRVLLNPPANLLGAWNAILSTTSVSYMVHGFAGPFSVKWMPSGWAVWETKRALPVTEDEVEVVERFLTYVCDPDFLSA